MSTSHPFFAPQAPAARKHGCVREVAPDKYKVTVELPADETGKRHQRSKTITGTREEAENLLQTMLGAAKKPETARPVEPPAEPFTPLNRGNEVNLTLNQFFRQYYLPEVRRDLRADTVAGYESDFERLIQPFLGGDKLSELTRLRLHAWVRQLSAKKAQVAKKMLSAILSFAVDLDLMANNPAKGLKIPKAADKYQPEVLTKEECEQYLRLYRGTTIEPAVLVIMGCGTTRSETLGLNWADISPDGAVHIDKAYVEFKGRCMLTPPKNEFRARTVHLPASILSRLNELRPASQTTESNGEEIPIPLVTGDDGVTRMKPDRLTRQFRKIQEGLPADVTRITLKNLRHTSLTLAIEAGVDIFAVSRRAGHSGTDITSKYYLRPHESLDISTAAALDDFLRAE